MVLCADRVIQFQCCLSNACVAIDRRNVLVDIAKAIVILVSIDAYVTNFRVF